MAEFCLYSIGTIVSPINEKKYTNWDEITCKIEIDSEYKEGLTGLEAYSHAIIVFYMDQFKDDWTGSWKKKPRGLDDLDENGCFAQRTKYRPNPLGISTAKILSIKDNLLIVSGLDANNGTKVLDIKPYIPEFDTRSDAHVPDWMQGLMHDYF